MSLVAQNITYAYRGARPVLLNQDLEVSPGERVAISAPSGAGKTTLCRVLSGYLTPQAGEVFVDGVPLARPRPGTPLPVQLIWQHPEQAFDPRARMGTSLSEVPAGRVTSTEGGAPVGGVAPGKDEASLLFERFGIRRAWLARFPHELSGGELMRFCIVRALLARPRYLVCDEMTAMLDAVTQAELWRAVLCCAEERAMGIAFVSHSPALTRRLATRQVRI